MTRPQEDQKNLILAIVLATIVVVAWQYIYIEPRMRAERERQAEQKKLEQAKQPLPSQAGAPQPGQQSAPQPGVPKVAVDSSAGASVPKAAATSAPAPAAAAPSTALSREDALKKVKRIPLEAGGVRGSLSLNGGRIDDVVLARYRETIDLKSKNVVLLSPMEGPDTYFAEFAWVQSAGSAVALPDSNTEWQLEKGQKLTPNEPVTLKWDNGSGIVFRRTISVDNDSLFTVVDQVENTTKAPIVLDHRAFISRHGTPKIEGFMFMHEGFLGVPGDKGLQEIAYATVLQNLKEGEQSSKAFTRMTGGWLGITDKYWATALIPDQKTAYDVYVTGFNKQGARKEVYQVDYFLRNQAIAPGAAHSVKSLLFAGAKKFDVIERYEAAHGIQRFDMMIDWGYLHFFTKPLFRLIRWLQSLLGNFGLAILGVTVLVKAAFFIPANWSYESMAKMKKLQPQIQAIQERYKDDPTRMRQAQMELMQKEKVSTMYGCLPMLLQIPVFFALYKVLYLSIDMRHAPFFGWIQDLSAPDPTTIFNLFGLIPIDPGSWPYIGEMLRIGIWPIIMGITTWIQFQLNPKMPDPTQQKIFAWMPLFLTFIMASFPVGLIIYWAWSNILTVLQQYFIMQRNGADIHLWKNLGLDRWLGPRAPDGKA